MTTQREAFRQNLMMVDELTRIARLYPLPKHIADQAMDIARIETWADEILDLPENEPEANPEPPQMTAVLGPKPGHTDWYKKALENLIKQNAREAELAAGVKGSETDDPDESDEQGSVGAPYSEDYRGYF